jgi:hypothetical protein
MLEEIGLVYTEKDDLIVITTPEDSSTTMEVRVYDCRDLLAMPVGLPEANGLPGGAIPGMSIRIPALQGTGADTGTFDFSVGPQRTDSATPAAGAPAGSGRRPSVGTPGAGLPGTLPAIGAPGTSSGGFGPPDAGSPPAAPGSDSRRTPRVPDSVLPQLGGLGGGGGGGFGGAPGSPMPGGMGMGGAGGMQPGMGGGMGMASGGMSPGGMGFDGGQAQRPMSEQDLKAEQLMNIVTTAVDPDSWSDVGGSGTIGQYNGLIVVSQSARTHAKIEKVLDMLREAGGLPKNKSPRVVR